jgi:hypothetical protein
VTINAARTQQITGWIDSVIADKPHLQGVFRVVDDYRNIATIL